MHQNASKLQAFASWGSWVLGMGLLRLVEYGPIAAAPPCSMYVAACSSVHRRSVKAPWGNLKNYKVRLAARIWRNTEPWTYIFWVQGVEMSLCLLLVSSGLIALFVSCWAARRPS